MASSLLLHKHADLWSSAIDHPFLRNCKNLSVTDLQFNTWLVQDYLFVRNFIGLAGSVLAKAPDSHQLVIIDGISSLKDEVMWFKAKAQERNSSTMLQHTSKHKSCEEYCTWMHNLGALSYPILAVAFWSIEYVYNQAWQAQGSLPEPYTEFGDRWGNAGFSEYVKKLQGHVDDALQGATEELLSQAEQVVRDVCRLEVGFWDRAFSVTAD